MTYEKLVTQLLEASDSYYNDSISIITDEKFDRLRDLFEEKYPDDPFLLTIGAKLPENSPWEKAKHKIPMSSLNKVKTSKEFNKALEGYTYCLSEKLDGISIEIEYDVGEIVEAITRGDGVIGEDITQNVIKMQGVWPSHYFSGILRGEIILKSADFEKVCSLRELRGQEKYENRRNAAGGISKKLNGQYSEYCSIMFYDTDNPTDTKSEKFFTISQLDLETPFIIGGVSSKEVSKVMEDYKNGIRDNLDYDIDGIVVEIDETDLYNQRGLKGSNPAGAVAWKFESLTASTELWDIEWSLGNSDIITPVAIFEPVHIGGVTIKRASLANAYLCGEFGFNEGDIIEVSRRNDVIPKVEKILEKNSKGIPFALPVRCPACQHNSHFPKMEGKFFICTNEDCDGKILGNLNKWVEKVEMKSLGFGEKTVEQLFDEGLLDNPADLYLLKESDLLELEGFKQRKAKIILSAIAAKKKLTLDSFIGGLNIKNWGRSMTLLLMEEGYDTLKALKSITIEELTSIKGIETKTATTFKKGLKKKLPLIVELKAAGVKIYKHKELYTIGPLSGLSFVFTGAIQKLDNNGVRLKRKDMQDIVINNGGETPDKVAKGLTYLVQADPSSQSSKTKKALNYGVKIIDEKEFFNLIKN